MSLLDEAVRVVESWDGKRNRDRARCLRLLERIGKRIGRGIAVWETFRERAPATGDRFTLVMWMGAKPARRLQALYLENKTDAAALTELTGVPLKDGLGLAEDLDVVQPYEQLQPGESGIDRAGTVIGLMSERKRRIEAVIERLGAGA